MQPERTSQTIAASLVVACIALFLPIESSGPLVTCWSLFCCSLIIRGRKNLEPQNRWWPTTLAAIVLAITIGNVMRALDGDQSISITASYADLVQLPAYCGVVYIAWRIFRSRAFRRDVDAWLDAAGVALGMFIVLWFGFLGRFILDPEMSTPTVVLNSTYNLLSLAGFGIVLRIASTPAVRPMAYRLMGLGYVAGFVADLSTAVSVAQGTGYGIAVALSPIAYGLSAAAICHPTANDVFSRNHVEQEHSVGLWRIFVIGIASVTPVLFLLDDRSHPTSFKTIAIIAAVALAFAVFFRVFRLLRSERRQAERDRLLAAELAQLSGWQADAIVDKVPDIATALCAGTTAKLANNDRAGYTSFPLSEALVCNGLDRLIVLPSSSSLSPSEVRSLELLILNAGHIAQTSELTALHAKQASEAEANKRIASNERRFRALVQNASDVVAVLSSDGEVTYISESCEKVLGYPADQFLGRTFEWIADDNDWEFAKDYLRATLSGTQSHQLHETRATHCDGSIKLLESVITDMRDVDGVEGLVVNISDVTEQRTLERNLRDAETTDALTLLLNRNAFVREADSAIRRASVAGHGVAMAIVNLDDFRVINEGYGTNVADEVLVELSHRVRQAVRLNDSVARLNGDEFGILMPDGYTAVEAEGIVERILDEIIEVISIAGHTIALRATAGLVMSRDGSASGISLLRDADTALDAAKQTNRGGLVHFEEAMGEEVSERVQLRNLLHDAIREGKLRLAFQPVVDIETGAIVSMEALARWTDPVRGEIGPSTFIPVAEATGMISELGEWALRTACTHVVEWAELGFDDFTVSVNMSGHQLREENVIAHVKRVLDETGVDPRRITIEITESVLIDDTDFIADRIRALRQLGLRLAIDDFGTGYSSLSYLRRYEFDVLKIDRSFVIPLSDDTNKREREIVNAMIKLAQALGAVTVAEGIEESEEYAVLRTLGCDFAQGFLFWYPTESEDVIDVLSSRSSKNPAA